MEQFLAESVVSGHQTVELLGAKAPKKAPQSVAVRKLWQAQKRRNQTVVNQRLSVLDAANSSHHRKQVGEKKIGRMIVAVMVIGPANVELQEVT